MGLKGATKLYRQFFCVRHKNRWKLNQHSQLLFLKINLHLDSHTKYLHFLPITSIYLVSSSAEMQRLVQTKVYYKLCYSVWKETSHKLLKVAAAKMFFLSVFIIDTTWFDECFFFIACDNWKALFFMQIYRYPEVWWNRHVGLFFETSFLKEVRILCLLSPHWHYNAANTKGPQ